MSVMRRWNLNEREGRYAATNIVEPEIEVHLGVKRTTGVREPVGCYRLDLEALANKGVVTRRVVAGNRVFDVQIYRCSDGTYSLGVRENHTLPLAQFKVS